MKRLLVWLGIAFGGLFAAVGLFVLSGYLLPSEVVLEVEQTLDASPESVFALLSTYDGVERWWRQASEDMGDNLATTHLGGPSAGAGMEVGFGSSGGPVTERWTYTEVAPLRRVEIDVDFQIFTSHRVLELSPEGAGTRVHWREVAQVDGPIWRWMVKLSTAGAMENRRTALLSAGVAAMD